LDNSQAVTHLVACPYCHEPRNSFWASENGFMAVKCSGCGMIYVNPRPAMHLIENAVKTGVHNHFPENGRTAISRPLSSKVTRYRRILASMFADVWKSREVISWLDVGAGYGETIKALAFLAPPGSKIEGVEPMKPKALHAQKCGLRVQEGYINEIQDKFCYVSVVNIFSHIPDFREFLEDVKGVLMARGEIFMETGNAGDLDSPNELPGELDLPDHLVFAGEKHLLGYLSEAGFSVREIRKERCDGLANFMKNIVKKILGRNVFLSLPYTSAYRSILIRAKML